MARLNQTERDALRRFARQAPLPHPPSPVLRIRDYLRFLSSLPPSLRPPKPANFGGSCWRL
ncbi:MAG: hypothetical protein K9M97_09685, partial [Akkermansiaceae bacterium]|nr:hypothetical protein [Akkermansiaceae bacterium]